MNAALTSYLSQLKQHGLQHNIPNVTEVGGRFLNMMIKVVKPKAILEIGCANGYSTLWMAEAARQVGAKIDAIDWSEPTFQSAQGNLAEAGFSDEIIFHFGDAREVVPKLNQQWDFVFVDGQKASYLEFWQALEPCLASGAVVIFDDMLAFPEKTTSFHEHIRAREDLEFTVLPLDSDDGVMMILNP